MESSKLLNPEGVVLRRAIYRYRHVVTFGDTNALGNAYYVQYLAWQGRCRELFLAQHVPGIVTLFGSGFRLVTLRASCEYYQEVMPLETAEICMSLGYVRQHRLGLDFDVVTRCDGTETLAARGFQEIACMIQDGSKMTVAEVPAELLNALQRFGLQ